MKKNIGILLAALLSIGIAIPAYAGTQEQSTASAMAEASVSNCNLYAIDGVGANPDEADYRVPAEITRYNGASIGKNGTAKKGSFLIKFR